MAKLWTSDGGDGTLDPVLEAFCFADDVVLDQKLVYYDVLGSLAHARMLKSIGVLDGKEEKELLKMLHSLYQNHEKGEWAIETSDEDVHTAIENRLGECGQKLHTARSRNDQVLTDMRLYAKDHLQKIALKCVSLGLLLTENAKAHEFVPMPGYTHLQRAMPSSYGMWLSSFSSALNDAARELKCAYELMDQCPLGSGAGYGVSLDIDREMTAELLGFQRVQANSIYCQNSRGHFEAVALAAMTSVLSICGRLSADICLYCTEEFSFIELPARHFTGSSIMPQKKNPDVFELIRSKVTELSSLEQRVRMISHALTSGYSKDLQDIKAPFMQGVDTTGQVLDVLLVVLEDMKPREENLSEAMSPELFAAHNAYEKVKEGIPFRQAYREVKNELQALDKVDAKSTIRQMKHTGATGNLQLDTVLSELKKEGSRWLKVQKKLDQTWMKLMRT